MKPYLILIIVVLVTALAWLGSDAQVQTAAPVSSHAGAAAPAIQPLPGTATVSVDQALQPALQQVSRLYRQQNRWPDYSIPLAAHQQELLQPNQAAAMHYSLQPLGLDASLTLQLDRYRYRYGEPAAASVQLQAGDSLIGQIRRLQLQVSDRRQQVLATLASEPLSNNQWQWRSEFEVAEQWPAELQLDARLQFADGQQLSYSVPFTAFTAVAEINGIAATHITDNQLQITLNIRDAEPGYYKLGAALLDQRQQPLAYLQGKGKIGRRGELLLKVHGSLLAGLNGRQDLILSALQLRRIPAKPGDGQQIGWGVSRESQYTISDIDPARFSDTPFQNAGVNARADFLENLSQTTQAQY